MRDSIRQSLKSVNADDMKCIACTWNSIWWLQRILCHHVIFYVRCVQAHSLLLMVLLLLSGTRYIFMNGIATRLYVRQIKKKLIIWSVCMTSTSTIVSNFIWLRPTMERRTMKTWLHISMHAKCFEWYLLDYGFRTTNELWRT